MKTPSTTNKKSELMKMDRRSFIALLAFVAASYPLSSLAKKRSYGVELNTNELEDPWRTIAAVQEHLFPAEENSPGAHDIQALTYLQNMMDAPDIEDEEKNFIKQGVTWLNDISQKSRNKLFIDLDENNREQVLRKIERSRAGERWLSLILTYLIEALLSDPVYGGNPGGIGWKWLEHQPGFPTPTQDKMYYKLGKPVHRRTKA